MRWILLFALATQPAVAQTPGSGPPITLGAAPALKLNPVSRQSLANGIPVLLMEKHNVPVVTVEIVVRGGSAFDPPELGGLASIMSAMMEEGAGGKSSLEFADAVDYLGASISSSSGFHQSGASLYTPVSKLDPALGLLADMVLSPMFPDEELERLRTERLTELTQWHDEPDAIASVLYNRTLFGEDHPYGKPALGNEESLRRITTGDIRGFYESIYNAGNATIIVVGDVEPAAIIKKLNERFGSWKGGESFSRSVGTARQVEGRQVYLVNKPDAEQSEIRVGRIGVERKHPDFFPIIVMNTILGGSFTSRLNQNLRERNGYSYGAFSGFDFRPSPGAFTASSAVQTDVTDKALHEFMNELQAIRDTLSGEELDRAKNYIALQLPKRFETVSAISSQLGQLVAFGLPDDYYNTYVEKVMAVTIADVRRVASERIDPASLAIVVVGDRAKIESGITALQLGAIHHLEVKDVLGDPPAPAD